MTPRWLKSSSNCHLSFGIHKLVWLITYLNKLNCQLTNYNDFNVVIHKMLHGKLKEHLLFVFVTVLPSYSLGGRAVFGLIYSPCKYLYKNN